MDKKERMEKDVEKEERHLIKIEYVIIAVLIIVIVGLVLYIWFK